MGVAHAVSGAARSQGGGLGDACVWGGGGSLRVGRSGQAARITHVALLDEASCVVGVEEVLGASALRQPADAGTAADVHAHLGGMGGHAARRDHCKSLSPRGVRARLIPQESRLTQLRSVSTMSIADSHDTRGRDGQDATVDDRTSHLDGSPTLILLFSMICTFRSDILNILVRRHLLKLWLKLCRWSESRQTRLRYYKDSKERVVCIRLHLLAWFGICHESMNRKACLNRLNPRPSNVYLQIQAGQQNELRNLQLLECSRWAERARSGGRHL